MILVPLGSTLLLAYFVLFVIGWRWSLEDVAEQSGPKKLGFQKLSDYRHAMGVIALGATVLFVATVVIRKLVPSSSEVSLWVYSFLFMASMVCAFLSFSEARRVSEIEARQKQPVDDAKS
jgi:hypothetical protein